MTFDEALEAVKRARGINWASSDLIADDGLSQAIEVFTRMNIDLIQCNADLEQRENFDCETAKFLFGEDKTDA